MIGGIYRRRLSFIDIRLALFLCGVAFCAIYAVATTGTGNVIVLLDTFFSGGMLALATGGLSDKERRQLRRVVQWLVIVNACIALGETMAQFHVVSVPNQAVENDREFRPTALYDHALTGAAVTMLGLWLAPRESGITRMCYVVVLGSALIAFGERAPFAVAAAAIFALSLRRHASGLRALRFTSADLGRLLGATVLLSIVGIIVLFAGYGTRLGAHLYWDESAQVRVSQFGILDSLSASELLFGCRRADLLALIEPLRLSSRVAVIENFWLFTFVALGALCFLVFALSVAALINWLWRRSEHSGRVMIVLFMLVASASNSLGRKSTLLMTLVACVMASGATNLALASNAHFGRYKYGA